MSFQHSDEGLSLRSLRDGLSLTALLPGMNPRPKFVFGLRRFVGSDAGHAGLPTGVYGASGQLAVRPHARVPVRWARRRASLLCLLSLCFCVFLCLTLCFLALSV